MPPPAPETRIAAVRDGGREAMSLGRWMKPWTLPPWGSLTGREICWITGGEWPGKPMVSVRGGKADGWSMDRGVVGLDGTGDEAVRSVVAILLVVAVVLCDLA